MPRPAKTEGVARVQYRNTIAGVNWRALKASLAADRFDNGRTAAQLKKSFANSQGVCFAWLDGRVVGTARVLSDGVCNAYMVDVWTWSAVRRRGIAQHMIDLVCRKLKGQHLYLQAEGAAAALYRGLGFRPQPIGMSTVIGNWLSKK